MDTAWDEFQKSKRARLEEFQKIEINSKQLLQALLKEEYTEELQADLKKHINRVIGICRIIGRAVTENLNKEKFPGVHKAMQTLDKADAKFKMAAARFGVKHGSAKRRKVE